MEKVSGESGECSFSSTQEDQESQEDSGSIRSTASSSYFSANDRVNSSTLSIGSVSTSAMSTPARRIGGPFIEEQPSFGRLSPSLQKLYFWRSSRSTTSTSQSTDVDSEQSFRMDSVPDDVSMSFSSKHSQTKLKIDEKDPQILPLEYDILGAPPLSHSPTPEPNMEYEQLLPADYIGILSRAVFPVSYSSMGDLYLRLCDSILIDNGKMSFALDRSTNKKCFMLSARELAITLGNDPHYWRWRSDPDSRFTDVAALLETNFLEIRGKIESTILSPNMTYIAYLIFKLHPKAHGFRDRSLETKVELRDMISTQEVCLHPTNLGPQAISNSWKAVSLGEFFNEQGDAAEVDIRLKGSERLYPKKGLIIQGIELRPK